LDGFNLARGSEFVDHRIGPGDSRSNRHGLLPTAESIIGTVPTSTAGPEAGHEYRSQQ